MRALAKRQVIARSDATKLFEIYIEEWSSCLGSPAPVRLRSRCARLRRTHFALRAPCVAAPRVARRAKRGAQGRNRTTDTAIFSRMLYQLSYLGVLRAQRGQRAGGL